MNLRKNEEDYMREFVRGKRREKYCNFIPFSKVNKTIANHTAYADPCVLS